MTDAERIGVAIAGLNEILGGSSVPGCWIDQVEYDADNEPSPQELDDEEDPPKPFEAEAANDDDGPDSETAMLANA